MSILLGTVLIGLTLALFSLRYLPKQTSPKPKLDPSTELAIITGGSGAIGTKIITALTAKGIKTINLDIISPSPGPTPTDNPSNSQTPFYHLDITNTQEITSTAQRIHLEHGTPTILINNAAIGSTQPILSAPRTQIQNVFQTNIISHFHLLQAFLPAMIAANHGHVVTVASMVSFMTQASNVDYACTKAAALALHEGLGQEIRFLYKANGVHTTIVHPSWVRTPKIQLLLDKGVPATESIVEPEDVASAIVEQIMLGTGAQILLPRDLAGLVIPFVRGFPCWVQEMMRDRVSRVMLKVLG